VSLSVDELVAYFSAGAKPRAQFRIGIEQEKIGARRGGAPVCYQGADGIAEVLARLEGRGFVATREGDHIIALERATERITIEPGGQLEFSGAARATAAACRDALDAHVREVIDLAAPLDIHWLGVGGRPFGKLDDVDWLPKARYGVMREYFPRFGRSSRLAHHMMKMTATVQANFDYESEADAVDKIRTAYGVSSIVTALFAASPIADGRPTGDKSTRAAIWLETDEDRCGLLPFVFEPGFCFRDYVEWALDVPMYFIIRNGDYVEATSVTFRQYMQGGFRGERATIEDWALHLTTLFPEVRLKRYLEVRSADSQPPEMMLALPALMKGVLYEPDSLEGAWDLVRRWTWEERVALYGDAHREGLKAKIRGISLAEIARELLIVAASGLKRQGRVNAAGGDERIYLERLQELVHHGKSQGRLLAERWEGEWQRDMQKLIAHTSYRLPEAA
jgi:glutamate--cysteine ligase